MNDDKLNREQTRQAVLPEPEGKSPKKIKTPFGRKKKDTEQIIRIKELEEIMGEDGEEIDEDKIVSMYMPHRRRRSLAAALLRLDFMQKLLLSALFLVCVLFILAFSQEKMGNFTINLNRLELYRKGIAISENGDFNGATARLTAATVKDATNISVDSLPTNLDSIDGGHNGDNYMAYTYYVRNAGKEDVGYIARVTLDSASKGAEDAVRVAVYRNGRPTVYAKAARDGNREPGTTAFESDRVVCSYHEENFLVGNVDKYTVVIWMEGDDPECVDKIIGGSVQFSMTIDADYEDETNLLYKFVKDIKDTLTGDKPIDAAGNEAGNKGYYGYGDVTWDTRRNKDDYSTQ